MVYFCLNKGIYKVLHKVSSRAKRRISSASGDALGTCGGTLPPYPILFNLIAVLNKKGTFLFSMSVFLNIPG